MVLAVWKSGRVGRDGEHDQTARADDASQSQQAPATSASDVGVSSRVMERQVIDDVEVQCIVGWNRTCIKADGDAQKGKTEGKKRIKIICVVSSTALSILPASHTVVRIRPLRAAPYDIPVGCIAAYHL